jgi:hypothetical protein
VLPLAKHGTVGAKGYVIDKIVVTAQGSDLLSGMRHSQSTTVLSLLPLAR